MLNKLPLLVTVLISGPLVWACVPRVGSEVTPLPEPPRSRERPLIRDFSEACDTYDALKTKGFQADDCRWLATSFEAIDEEHNGFPEAVYNAGVVWQECDEHIKATSSFERANASAKTVARRQGSKRAVPGYPPALVQLGGYAARRGDAVAAGRLFERAREADRRSETVYTNLSRLHRHAGRFTKAQLDVRRALAVKTGYMPAFAEMVRNYAEGSRDNRALLGAAELVCQHALGEADHVSVDPRDVARVHNSCGVVAARRGDHARAVHQFDRARGLDRELCEAHLNAGAASLAYRDYRHAEQALLEARRCQPGSYAAHLSLGAAQRGLKQYVQARASYEKARSIDPAQGAPYYNLGVLLQDYLVSESEDMAAQVAILGQAKMAYRDFLTRCQQGARDCERQRPDGERVDLREVAAGRIKACDATAAALQEATRLAAEAAAAARRQQ